MVVGSNPAVPTNFLEFTLTPIILTVTIVSLATYGLSHLYRTLAIRRNILAHTNERSAHVVPTPTGGGVAFVVVFAVALATLWIQGFIMTSIALAMLGPVAVSIVGFVDDLTPLPVTARVPLYLLGCVWSMYWIGFPVLNILGAVIDLGWYGIAFGVISLIWLQNLYNFMDGIDGLAISEAAFVCAAVFVIGGNVSLQDENGVALLIGAVSIGFAVINWPSARIFMGDVGSSFLGLSLGVLALAYNDVAVWVWMILLGWFLTDGCLTITVRLIRGEKIYQSHNLHAYQHLTRRFGSQKTLVFVLLVNVIWLAPIAYLAHRFPDMGVVLLVLASAPLLICQWLCGAGQPTPRLGQLTT